jgi:hypothetical protein
LTFQAATFEYTETIAIPCRDHVQTINLKPAACSALPQSWDRRERIDLANQPGANRGLPIIDACASSIVIMIFFETESTISSF